VHLHGIESFDTQTDSADEILSIAQIEGVEGVTGVLLSIYPAPIPVMRRHLAAVKKAMERQENQLRVTSPALDGLELSGTYASEPATCNLQQDLYPTPDTPPFARILGVHLEGPFLNPLCCGALDPRTFVSPSWYVYRQVIEGLEDTIKSITVAPELKGAPELIGKIAQSGVVVSMGHSDATYAEAEAGFHAGATGVTHIFNAMRPFAHRDPGISGFALTTPDIYVEVIADPHHLHLETIRLVFKVKPANRILIVSDSVKGASAATTLTQDRKGGSIPAITGTGKLRGGSMTIVASSARLIAAGFAETAVMGAITDNPARFLNP
jgi:N-acetylglucosamine-6-phosphate deacetylase